MKAIQIVLYVLAFSGVKSQIPAIDLDDVNESDFHQSSRFDCSPPTVQFSVQGNRVRFDLTARQNATLPTVGAFFVDQGEDVYTSYDAQDWLTNRNTLLTYDDMPMLCEGVASSLTSLSPSLDVSSCSNWALVATTTNEGSDCGHSRLWRYELNIDEFRNKSFVSSVGNRATWAMWTFELMSELERGSIRYVRHEFQLDYMQTAAVGISIDAGDLMSPAFIDITRLLGERSSDTEASFTMETEVYTRYTEEGDEITLNTIYAPQLGSLYTCEAPIKVKTGDSLALADTGESIQRLFTDVDLNGNFRFNRYSVTFTCSYVDSSVSASDNIVLGGEEISIKYELYNSATGEIVSDRTDMPSFKMTFSITLSPVERADTVTTPLELRILTVSEELYSASTSVSEMRNVLDAGSPLTGSIAFTQAFSLHVRTEAESARGYWTIDPKFIILSLHQISPGTDITGEDSFTTVSADGKLSASFCGLDRSDIVGTVIIQDGTTHSFDQNLDYNWTDIMQASMLEVLLETQVATAEDVELLNGKNFSSLRVNDASGGYYVPMRHKFRFDGVSGGYSMRACILNEMLPRDPALVSRRLLRTTSFSVTSFSEELNIPHSSFQSADLRNVIFETEDQNLVFVDSGVVFKERENITPSADEMTVILLAITVVCFFVGFVAMCCRKRSRHMTLQK